MEATSPLFNLTGSKLLKAVDGKVTTVMFNDFMTEFQKQGKFVCFYFGAHWAPPCRLFTKTLESRFYNEVNTDGKQVEVIFVSDDREEDHFERNFVKMPWLAVPFDDDHRKQTLKSRFGVHEIPTLVVVCPTTGEVITHDGRD